MIYQHTKRNNGTAIMPSRLQLINRLSTNSPYIVAKNLLRSEVVNKY